MRYRVKAPSQFARAHIVRPDIARRRRKALRRPAADNQQILIDDSRRGERHRLLRRVAPQVLAQIDPPLPPEPRDRLAGTPVQRVHEAARPRENPPLTPLPPTST